MGIALSLTTIGAFGVFADTTYTITINKDTTDKADHTYGAFQIFKGDLDVKTTGEGASAVTTKTLSNIQWGDNVSSANIIEDLSCTETCPNR
jgi:hypothetical protein